MTTPNAKHSNACTMSFGKARPETGCTRCIELANGAAPRKGWSTKRRDEDMARSAAIRNHNCAVSHCGPVCTAFDW
jgi:hypothetical protein